MRLPTLVAGWRFRESRRVVACSRVPQLESDGSAERETKKAVESVDL